jgi:hypothetical protein
MQWCLAVVEQQIFWLVAGRKLPTSDNGGTFPVTSSHQPRSRQDWTRVPPVTPVPLLGPQLDAIPAHCLLANS